MDDVNEKRLAEVRARAAASTPGPWSWWGTPKQPYLATVDRGRMFIMQFVRSGMSGATVMWQGLAPKRGMVRTDKVAVKEVEYRDDLARIDHPDAEFIAHSRSD